MNGNLSEQEPENRLRNDLEALEYSPIPVDSILLGYLESGSFDQEGFKTALPSLTALQSQHQSPIKYLGGQFNALIDSSIYAAQTRVSGRKGLSGN
jgi:hypothetical protein